MTKQDILISSLNLIPINTSSDDDLYIDARPLLKRVNALIMYSSDLGAETPADKHAREISIHIKILKEIHAHNTIIAKLQTSEKRKFTSQEEEALAAELAALIFKTGSIV